MSTTIKFLILYLIPIVTFASSVGVYVHGYGKSPRNTYVNFAFFFVILGFISSSIIAITLLSQFISGETILSGIIFSILPWVADLIVVGLYVYVFYGFYGFR